MTRDMAPSLLIIILIVLNFSRFMAVMVVTGLLGTYAECRIEPFHLIIVLRDITHMRLGTQRVQGMPSVALHDASEHLAHGHETLVAIVDHGSQRPRIALGGIVPFDERHENKEPIERREIAVMTLVSLDGGIEHRLELHAIKVLSFDDSDGIFLRGITHPRGSVAGFRSGVPSPRDEENRSCVEVS